MWIQNVWGPVAQLTPDEWTGSMGIFKLKCLLPMTCIRGITTRAWDQSEWIATMDWQVEGRGVRAGGARCTRHSPWVVRCGKTEEGGLLERAGSLIVVGTQSAWATAIYQLVWKLFNILTHGMPCHTCFQEGLGKKQNQTRDWGQHCWKNINIIKITTHTKTKIKQAHRFCHFIVVPSFYDLIF